MEKKVYGRKDGGVLRRGYAGSPAIAAPGVIRNLNSWSETASIRRICRQSGGSSFFFGLEFFGGIGIEGATPVDGREEIGLLFLV